MNRYRTFSEADYETLQAVDLQVQRQHDPAFDSLPEREKTGRLHTSLSALKFYERSEHSFVAEDQQDRLLGFIFAQSVWQGDRPIVLVRTLSVAPTLAPEAEVETVKGLMHATVKSAYDSAVYEVHFAANPLTHQAAAAEEAHLLGQYSVVHLGTRAQTASGQKLLKSELLKSVRTPDA